MKVTLMQLLVEATAILWGRGHIPEIVRISMGFPAPFHRPAQQLEKSGAR
jgi:hypothetical protein